MCLRFSSQTASALLWALIMLVSCPAIAQDAGPPRDAYGRPLADQAGRIRYNYDGERWIAIHADGREEPAPPIKAEVRVPLAAASSLIGYTLDAYQASYVGSYPYAVAIGDVTGDGHADVVLLTTFYFDSANDYSIFVFPQEASGTLGAPRKYRYVVPTSLAGLVVTDLDENAVQDVVVGHAGGITVFLADGDGGLLPGAVVNDGDATVLQAADVDRDGHVDIISLGQTRGATVFFGDGHGAFPRKIAVATNADGFNDLESGDLNGDGLIDLAVLNGPANSAIHLSVHRNDGEGGFVSPPDPYQVEPFLFRGGVGVGDVTGDGRGDAVVSRPRNTPTWLWIMPQDGSGALTGPTPLTSYDIPEPVVVTDLDRDGRADVAVLHGGWNRVGIYLQGAGGRLGSEALYPIPYASHYPPQGLAVGDFTSDGCPDVAIADYNSGLVVLHGQGCAECVPGAPSQCDDGNVCTADACDTVGRCVHQPVLCDDDDCCTVDSCDPATGCVHAPNTAAPVFTAQPSLGACPALWPPNHLYADFTVAQTGAAASGMCGIASIVFASCSSSQPENGSGTADGNTTRDCVFEPGVVHLRAERDGACSPIGRVYETRLVATDVCGNATVSDPLAIGVHHDRRHAPQSGTIYAGTHDDEISGDDGDYGAGCGTGGTCVNGVTHDDSDEDPEMEIAQSAAVSVDDLRLVRGVTGIQLEWTAPLQFGITRYHVWTLDPMVMSWTQIGGEVDRHATSFPAASEGTSRHYKVTAVIK